jgi:ankyrin repeat protein
MSLHYIIIYIIQDLNTPLHYAAYQGHETVCELLLDHGANINITNASGCTPLFYASQQSRVAVAKLLLEKGGDITIAEKEVS